MKKFLLISLIISSLSYSDVIKVEKYNVDAGNYKISYEGKEREFITGLNPGYGSALTFKEQDADGTLEFYAVTDRGPNADIPKYIEDGKIFQGKFFPVPDFNPNIGVIRLKGGKAEVIKTIPIKDFSGEKISGRVIPQGIVGSTGEIALDFDMKKLPDDINGLDTEGIAVDKNGNFWLCDEYGPFILKLDKHGKILEKYGPKEGLPEILKYRVPNRGFEGLTIDENNEVFAAVQSPLDINNETGKTAEYTRIIKFNPETKKTSMYAYPVDKGYENTSVAKIGDLHSIGNGKFLLIEQGVQNGKMQNLIYMIDITDASIIPEDSSLEYGKLKNFVPIKKELLVDIRKYGWDIEKAEGITLLPDRKTIVVVNDNDFGIKTKIDDSENKNPQLDDYTYNADKKQFIYKGKKAKHVKAGITSNSETEKQSQIWLFHLDKALD